MARGEQNTIKPLMLALKISVNEVALQLYNMVNAKARGMTAMNVFEAAKQWNNITRRTGQSPLTNFKI